jgi:hypothetical protein
MKRMRGLTIVQLMLILLIAGLIGKVVIDLLVEKRCADQPASALCRDHGT